jgi:hypothetical protein
MKRKMAIVFILFFCIFAISSVALGQNANGTNVLTHLPKGDFDLEKTKKRLLKDFDLNGNGKIDASEHRDYLRAVAIERRQVQRKAMVDLKSKPRPPLPKDFDPATDFLRKKSEANQTANIVNRGSISPKDTIPSN